MRVWPNGLALLGGLGAVLLVSCGKPDNAKVQRRGETQARAVRVARVELRPMERAVQVVGTLSAHDGVTVAARVAGKLKKSHGDWGARVTRGREMVLIAVPAYEALVRKSAANLARATASASNAAQNLKRIQDLQKD